MRCIYRNGFTPFPGRAGARQANLPILWARMPHVNSIENRAYSREILTT